MWARPPPQPAPGHAHRSAPRCPHGSQKRPWPGRALSQELKGRVGAAAAVKAKCTPREARLGTRSREGEAEHPGPGGRRRDLSSTFQLLETRKYVIFLKRSLGREKTTLWPGLKDCFSSKSFQEVVREPLALGFVNPQPVWHMPTWGRLFSADSAGPPTSLTVTP